MPKLKIDLIVDDKGSIVIDRFGDKTNKVMWSAGRSVKEFSKELKIAGAAMATVIASGSLLAKKVIDISDEYTLLSSRLGLVTESAEQLDRVETKLYKTALATHAAYSSTANLYTGLARSTKELHLSEEQLVNITDKLNKAAIISGASQEDSANSMRQLNQAMQGGVVRAEEYNSILENTPRILEAVASGLGITMGKLRKEMLEGKLSAERFLEGFQKGSAGIDSEFSKMSITVKQALGDLKTVFNSIIFDGSKSASVTSTLSGEIEEFTSYLDDHRDDIVKFFGDGTKNVIALGKEIKNLGVEARPYLDDVATSISAIYNASKVLHELGGPSTFEWGIVGYALLRGGPQAAALTLALVSIKDALVNLDAAARASASKNLAEGNSLLITKLMNEAREAYEDYKTIAPTELIEKEIKELEQLLEETGDPVGDFFRKIFTGSEKSDEQIAAISAIKDKISELKRELNSIGQEDFDEGFTEWTSDYDGVMREVVETTKKTGGEIKKTTEELKKFHDAAASLRDIEISAMPEGLGKELAKLNIEEEKLKERVAELGKEAGYTEEQVNKLDRAIDAAFAKKRSDATKKSFKELNAAIFETGQSYDVMVSDVMAGKDVLTQNILDQSDLLSPTATAGVASDLEELMNTEKELWEGSAQETKQIQEMLMNDLGRIMDGYISDILHGQIDSIDDLFKGLFDSILDMFIRLVSQMAANSIVDAIFGAGASGGITLGALFSAGGGLLGKGLSLVGLGSSISGLFGGPSIAGSVISALGLGGGAAATAGGLSYGTGPYASIAAYQAAIAQGVAQGMTSAEVTSALSGAGTTAGETIAGLGAGSSTTSGGGATLAGGSSTLGAAAGIGAFAWIGYNLLKGAFGDNGPTSPNKAVTHLWNWNQSGMDADEWDNKAEQWARAMQESLNSMQAGFGDTFAALRSQLEPTQNSVENFVESLTGIGISSEQSAQILQNGLQGNTQVIRDLLQSIGAGTEIASAGAIGLVASLAKTNQSARQQARDQAKLQNSLDETNQSVLGMDGYIDELSHRWVTAAEVAGNAARDMARRAQEAADRASQSRWIMSAEATINVAVRGAAKAEAEASADAGWDWREQRFRDGGILEGGSGKKDDLYMGRVGGYDILAQGGEYFMPPEQTAMYFPELELMRKKQFAGGGILMPWIPPAKPPDTAPEIDYRTGAFTNMKGWDESKIREFTSYIEDFNDVIASSKLGEYSKSVYDLNKQYAEIIGSMQKSGASEKDIAKARFAQSIELSQLDSKRAESLSDLLSKYRDINAGRSDYAQSLEEERRSYYAAIMQARELKATNSEINEITEAYHRTLKELAAEQEKIRSDFLDPFEDIINKSGLSDYEKQVYELNKRYEEATSVAKERNYSEEDLNKIEQARLIELKELENIGYSSFSNLNDVLKEIEQFGIQSSVLGQEGYSPILHEKGGIAISPHIIGEGGTEGLLPLRSPQQINHIEDKLDALIRATGNTYIYAQFGDEEIIPKMVRVAQSESARQIRRPNAGTTVYRQVN